MKALLSRVLRTRSLSIAVPAVTLGAAILAVCTGTAAEPASSGEPTQSSAVEHGHYLVHSVAMCVQCHSARNSDGELLESKLLQGGPIPFSSPYTTEWAFRAPIIAGLPGYSDEDAIRLLTQGYTKNGAHPKAPMPPFRMSRKDAEAVVAYLRSQG